MIGWILGCVVFTLAMVFGPIHMPMRSRWEILYLFLCLVLFAFIGFIGMEITKKPSGSETRENSGQTGQVLPE